MAVPCLELTGGCKMPILGFGTWQATDEELDAALTAALTAGYRHIDTAYVYENEAVIGRVLNRWLSSGKVRRDDLFIVTKLPAGGNRPSTVEKYCRKSLELLQLEYVDQYLVHVPITLKEDETALHPVNENGEVILEMDTDHVAIWKEMEKLKDKGLARSIGLSNFNIRQIERVLSHASIPPATLQIELHVYFQQTELVDFCKKNHISVTAYSPLGSRGLGELMKKMGDSSKILDLIDNPEVKAVAEKHKRSPAQVLLRYIVQLGVAAIPKSTNPERLKQNISIFDFKLDDDDCKRFKALDRGNKCRVCDLKGFLKGADKHPEFPW